MIRNQHQLKVAQRKLRDLVESANASVDPVDEEQYTQMAADIQREVDEYVQIRDGFKTSFDIAALDDVIDALVKARIAKGLTQADLADLLDVAEQQVQKDEANGYRRASWDRIADVIDALGYELTGELAPCRTHDVDAGLLIAFSDHVPQGGSVHTWFGADVTAMTMGSLPNEPAVRRKGDAFHAVLTTFKAGDRAGEKSVR